MKMKLSKNSLPLSMGIFSLFLVSGVHADIDRANLADEKANAIIDRLHDISKGNVDRIEKDIEDNVRRRAMRDAAESLGAQEGYNYYVNRFVAEIERKENFMHHFDFSSIMTAATNNSTEMYVLPPVIEKLENAEAVSEDGMQLKLTGEVYRILSNVRLVTAPPTWRDYLLPRGMSNTNTPPEDLLPKDREERGKWEQWVNDGFDAGLEQGDREMRHRVSQLRTDFVGMIRYMNLVEKNMVKKPEVAMQHIRTEGDAGELKVRSSVYEVTQGAELIVDHNEWSPAFNDNDRTNLK
jgi:defect-in-organelle-trafficking protein DotC